MTGPAAGEPTAARAYKDVIAGLDAAASALREADRERAARLAQELVGRQDAMQRAVERAAVSRSVLLLHWERVLEALWTESWLTLRPLPDPPPAPGDLDALDVEVQERAEALLAAVRRRRFGLPGR
ncbi:MAG: hypothetical protein NTW05_27920 [Pseudonocardiales bacterium]|nr:hypothetical protein [Pseudonocardiales bacterium]